MKREGLFSGLFAVALAAGIHSLPVAGATIDEDFANPPVAARPYVWWHWLGYNVSSNGIVRDLTAMKESGIGGATIFSIASQSGGWCGTPTVNRLDTTLSYYNDAWLAMLKHAVVTADRLGLELGIHNCPGFSVSGGPWIRPEHAMKKVVWSVADAPATPAAPEKGPLGWYREIGTVTANGKTYRFGYVACDYKPCPCPRDIEPTTFECDKMNAAAVKCHLDHVLAPLKKALGPHLGRTFRHLLMDSYEAGPCDWTDDFREEFMKRRGYDPLPFLPVLADVKMEGGDRFREDHARTVEELYTERHYRQIHDRLTAEGLLFALEPYGGPFDGWEASRYAHVPMVEFWASNFSWQKDPAHFGGYPGLTGAAGRAFGRRVLASESFTGYPTFTRWDESPRTFKPTGDAAYVRGINRLTLHHWSHQPFDPKWKPGNTMGFWGSHFGENQTWFEPGKAYFAYLGRCQALLQRGEPVVEELALRDEPVASEFDAIPESTYLNELTVLPSGGVKLPSGRVYRLLRLSRKDGAVVSLAVAKRTRELVGKGVAIWAPARFKRARGRANAAADAQVQAIAAELWDKPHKNFFTGSEDAARRALGIRPGFEVLGDNDRVRPVMGNHRREGDADWFFVANTSSNAVRRTIAFNVTGKRAEVWNPERGTKADAPCMRTEGGRTVLDYDFEPFESKFFVFREFVDAASRRVSERPAASFCSGEATRRDAASTGGGAEATRRDAASTGGGAVATRRDAASTAYVTGQWSVTFEPDRGAPAGVFALERLQSLTEIDVPGIRYFSGTATYRKIFPFNGWYELKCPDGTACRAYKLKEGMKRLVLDLGDVRDLAEVTVNGKHLGVAWHPPYAFDVTDALTDSLTNEIVIKVTNTWRNRLIGDHREPDDCEWGLGNERAGDCVGRPLNRLPDFVLKNTPRPSSGRVCFALWDYFGVNSPLVPSGLIGPVTLKIER